MAERVIELEPAHGYPRVLAAAARTRMGEGAAMMRTIDSRPKGRPAIPCCSPRAARRGSKPTGSRRLGRISSARCVPSLAIRSPRWHWPARCTALAPHLEGAWMLLAEIAAARGDTAERDSALVRVMALRAAAP